MDTIALNRSSFWPMITLYVNVTGYQNQNMQNIKCVYNKQSYFQFYRKCSCY